jgi:hypothetical protein
MLFTSQTYVLESSTATQHIFIEIKTNRKLADETLNSNLPGYSFACPESINTLTYLYFY